MKLMDKLKNALFEEEYVEVEEKPKKIKKKEQKIPKSQPKQKEEKPIAKKIVLPERKEVKVTNHVDEEEQEEIKQKEVEKNEFKFPMVSDNEFSYPKEKKFNKPKVDSIEQPPKQKKEKIKQEKEEKKSKPYGLDSMPIKEPEYGTYEKKEEKTYFKPSPIISPIYGILDKNYTKDDIIPKKEVRLTSSYARENLDVDEVRNRAYGSLEDDIVKHIHHEEVEETSIMDNDLLDLSVNKPEVSKVTVGDAEEYFEDLGLEYNVDYKDTSKEKRVTRYHSDEEETSDANDTNNEDKVEDEGPYIVNEEVSKEFEVQKEETPKEKEPQKNNVDTSDDLDEDNLFDLIDSMYEKE